MNKRDKIYVLLLVFVAIGVIVDWLMLLGIFPTSSLNYWVGMIGIIVFCRLWQNEDSTQLGHVQSVASKSLTIIFPIVGTAIHFIESRQWKSAILEFFLFWLGIIATGIVTVHLNKYLWFG
jgi:hypothetical protein